MERDIAPFDRPIPGQSLTDTHVTILGKPAEMSDIEEVQVYIEELANDEVINDVAALCQTSLPLKPVVTSIVSSGNLRYAQYRCRYVGSTRHPVS